MRGILCFHWIHTRCFMTKQPASLFVILCPVAVIFKANPLLSQPLLHVAINRFWWVTGFLDSLQAGLDPSSTCALGNFTNGTRHGLFLLGSGIWLLLLVVIIFPSLEKVWLTALPLRFFFPRPAFLLLSPPTSCRPSHPSLPLHPFPLNVPLIGPLPSFLFQQFLIRNSLSQLSWADLSNVHFFASPASLSHVVTPLRKFHCD